MVSYTVVPGSTTPAGGGLWLSTTGFGLVGTSGSAAVLAPRRAGG
jgi:hypothetical protein